MVKTRAYQLLDTQVVVFCVRANVPARCLAVLFLALTRSGMVAPTRIVALCEGQL